MRKTELVTVLAKNTGIHKVDVMVILESFFRETKASLIEGEPVFFRGFGSFVIIKKARKRGRNLNKNTIIEIPEHLAILFKPAREFKLNIKENGKSETEYSDKD